MCGSAVGTRLIELEGFVEAVPAGAAGSPSPCRHSPLVVGPGSEGRVGATGTVRRVRNVLGEDMALKVLRCSPAEASPALERAREAAFLEEYRSDLLVSNLRGFPRVFGIGRAEGRPAILMEWVEGRSLAAVARDRGGVWEGRLVAALGRDVLRVLEGASSLDDGFAHRDLSPRNIILRTAARSVLEQMADESFDPCLIDLGSATGMCSGDSSFTMEASIWRGSTPDYAPPEMLTRDVPGVERLRHSPAVDVYALCSVLYELYCGLPPFDLAARPGASEYLVKTTIPPAPLLARARGDEALCNVIMSGISADPSDRPSVAQLRRGLEQWLSTGERPAVEPGTRRRPIAPAAIVGAACAIGAAVLLARRGSSR